MASDSSGKRTARKPRLRAPSALRDACSTFERIKQGLQEAIFHAKRKARGAPVVHSYASHMLALGSHALPPSLAEEGQNKSRRRKA